MESRSSAKHEIHPLWIELMSANTLPPVVSDVITDYPKDAVGLSYITYPAGPVAVGTTITASASTNTKGSYTQFVSSSPFDCNYLYVEVITASVSGGKYLFDIATGGAGSETVILPNLLCDRTTATTSHNGNGLYALPVSIPAGTRIALRCQCSTGSGTLEVAITLVAAGGTPGITTYTNYGALTASSSAAQIDPGGTADTKGAYTEITSGTSAISQAVLIMFSTAGLSTTAGRRWAVDIATGGSGSEAVLIPDIRVGSGNGVAIYPRTYFFLTYIPASTRIAARASCSVNTAGDRLLNVAILAAPSPI